MPEPEVFTAVYSPERRRARPDDSDGAREASARRRLLRTECMFDARGCGSSPGSPSPCFRQWMTAHRADMNPAPETLRLQPRLLYC